MLLTDSELEMSLQITRPRSAIRPGIDLRLTSVGRPYLRRINGHSALNDSSEHCQGSPSPSEQPQCPVVCLPDSVARLFAGVAGWPSLTRLLHEEGNRVLTGDGLPGFIRAGGLFRQDGYLTFSRGSSRFLESVHRVLARCRGLIELDESGTEWAVLPQPNGSDYGSFPAWAVSYPGDLRLLDPAVRRPLGLSAEACSRAQSTDRWPIVVDPVHRKAAALEQALQMATLLSRSADANLECFLCPHYAAGTSIAGSDLLSLLISPLTTLSRVMIRRIDLRPDDEFAALQRSTSAVAAFEVVSDRSVWVRISEDLPALLGAYQNS